MLSGARQVQEIFVDPLPNFDFKKLKGAWFYEKTNPFPQQVRAYEAFSFLPIVIEQDREIIIRDRETKKVILAVYRNRIGPDALEIMQDTIKEMMQLRRKIARSSEIKKLD
jgi:hypothetical protein